ncbi:hypothetical protein DNTS_003296 [Danionella cerebrum]|uniref:BTB domain-containing protein n=1 Tax=Danionella cerebrum TaxID=2873325 RepID=A0A553MVL3_9TELE|nr:hypothetical protein DNTS_003296 [Danionella translucida]
MTGCSFRVTMDSDSFLVDFPDFSCSLLQKLNQQRQRGQLCDLMVCISGHQFRAHRAVLAASSPYFCDQVLLKNSARVVLPDVMPPCVFEQLLLSCYTGTLAVPSGEVVAFLTAASFLQMWHVVDKCTELLEVGTKKKCSGNHFEHVLSPKEDGFEDDEEISRDLLDDGLTNSASAAESLEHEGSSSLEDLSSEPGSDAMESLKSTYVPQSVMGLQKIKSEKKESCGGGLIGSANGSGENFHNPNTSEEYFKDKLAKFLERNCSYDDPLDFYGTSQEGFPPTGAEMSKNKLHLDENTDNSGLKEETSQSGFASVVYKLYQCQCGKSFTHKSQRDRHMSMHLGLRPFGCAVCGKSFKMKHHLVGHMKIHTGVKPYECSECSKRFMWRDSFNRHTSTCAKANQSRRAAQSC